ncbi:MAG: lipoyl synthase [Pseudomonadota bacterium]|nr:lipoyl synthase [Pseudomonadota bacterium]
MQPKPSWLKTSIPHGDVYFNIRKNLRAHGLVTVCEEAKCPNIGECWNTGTATFMVLGDTCTRACRFCHVKTGKPPAVDALEPQRVADSVRIMNLDYAVITMVDRDDLDDGGVAHLVAVVKAVRAAKPQIKVELLTSDFAGNIEALKHLLTEAPPDVFAHNIETIARLSPRVRDARASYQRSLQLLQMAKRLRPTLFTKSALMLGLGEEREEVKAALQDLRAHAVDLLTIGQYMRPTPKHLRVKSYAPPQEFAELQACAKELGFLGVAAGALVRSSYRARDFYLAASKHKQSC